MTENIIRIDCLPVQTVFPGKYIFKVWKTVSLQSKKIPRLTMPAYQMNRQCRRGQKL